MINQLGFPSGYLLEERYEIRSFVRRSFEAFYYRAKDIVLGREILIKHFQSPCKEYSKEKEFKTQFYREGKLLSLLSHPSIPRYYGDFCNDLGDFLLIEDIKGETLEEFLEREGKISLHEALNIGRQILEILFYLHMVEPPIVYGNLKPENILISNSKIALYNFFYSFIKGDKDRLKGPFGYYSFNSYTIEKGCSPLDDIYSAGIIIYRMITGVNPYLYFPGESFKSLKEIEPSVPIDLSQTIERALNPYPPKRIYTAGQFLAGLTFAKSIEEDAFICEHCKKANPSSTYFCSFCGCPVLKKDESNSFKIKGRLQRAVDYQEPEFLKSEEKPSLDPFLYSYALMASRPLGFDNLLTIDHNLIDEFPHQIKVVKKALKSMGGRCLLADEVGLGKTIEACIIMEELKARGLVKSILVVVPAHLRYQWQEELKAKFKEDFKVYSSSKSVDLKNDNKIIVSYSAISRRGANRDTLLSRKWDLLIADEAHHARNHKTLRWKFLNALKKDYVLLLSATPVQNQLSDLFNLITLLRPGHLSNKKDFKREFVDSKNPRRPKNSDSLKRLMMDVMIRTRRADAMITFPRRIAATKVVKLDWHEANLYSEVIDFIKELALKDSNKLPFGLMALVQRLSSSPEAASQTFKKLAKNDKLFNEVERSKWQQFCLLSQDIKEPSKVNETLRIISEVGEPMVIFTDYRATQDFLLNYLKKLKISAYLYRGDAIEKHKALLGFRKNKGILIASQAAGEGLNLQDSCNVLLNYDLPWNPMRLEQRIGRLQRLGQSRDVYVFNLVGEGTIESYILKVLDEKIKMFEMAVGQLDLILGTRFEDEGSFEKNLWSKFINSTDKDKIEENILSMGDELKEDLKAFEDIKENTSFLDEITPQI